MEKMLVVVFDSESKAYEGTNALSQLGREGSIEIYAESVIKKNGDGKTVVLKTEDEFPLGTLGGTAIGSLIGLLGGPYGVIIGAASGSLVGAVDDLSRSSIGAEFVDDVSARLTPGKYAVVADISEEWVTPMDVKMEKLGGQVFRTAKLDVETEQMKRAITAYDLEIAQLEKERKEAADDRKAKLQAKIDKLKEKRQKKVEQANQRLEQMKNEHDRKVQGLKKKAVTARGNMKAAIDARVDEMNKDYQRTMAKWKTSEAERLENKAELLGEKAKKLRSEASAPNQSGKA